MAMLRNQGIEQKNQQSVILVANESAASVSIIDAEQFIIRATIPVEPHPTEIVTSPSGQFALVSSYGSFVRKYAGHTLSYIDIKKQSVFHNIDLPEKSRPHGIAFLTEEEALITAEGSQVVYQVNVKTREVTKVIPIPGKGVHMVVVDKARRYAYVTNPGSGTACRIDLQDTSVIDEIKIGDQCEGIMLSSKTGNLYITSCLDNTVSVVSTESFKVMSRIKTAMGPVRIAEFDHGNAAVVINSISGNLQTIDLTTGKVIGKLKTYQKRSKVNGWFFAKLLPGPVSVVVRDDQQTAYVTNMYAGTITLVDLKKLKILHEFEASQAPDGLSLGRYSLSD